MPKKLHKGIMKRSRLGNIFQKHQTDYYRKNYNTKEISVKNFLKISVKTLRNLILKILTLKQLLITDVSGGLSYQTMASENLDPIMSIIKFFDKHPSTVKIKIKVLESTFHFRKAGSNEGENITSNLKIKNSCQQEDIPTKINNLNKYMIDKLITENVHSCIDEGDFPSQLKHADIGPIHKSKIRTTKLITDQ